ncbi:hypothetical protein L7F22_043648 [Adiantum nelumboides]|nr:hypothetical protein [Adiantum nelumboides]
MKQSKLRVTYTSSNARTSGSILVHVSGGAEPRPSSSFRPSPSPSITSQSDDPDREEDDEVEDDEDDEDYTDVGPSFKDRRNTLKARGSAALVPKVNTSESWSVTPATARNASAATLPHEILLHIFKYVSINPPDLRRSLTVCKAWCLCGVELLWHRPSFYRISSLFKLIHNIRKPDQTFPYATFIRRLNLSLLGQDLEDSLFSRMDVCTRLERLTLTQCNGISDDTLSGVLKHTKHLVAADFTDVENLTDKTVFTIAENCPRLQGINLSGCKKVTSASIAALAKNCKLLRRVKLCGCDLVGDEALAALAEHCPVLLEVDLINCPLISDASVRKIWQFSFHMRELRLAQCGKLTDLAFPAPPSTLQSSADAHIHSPIAHGQISIINQGMSRGSDSAPTSRGASPMGNTTAPQSRPLNLSSSHDTLPRVDIPMHTHLRPSRMFDHLRILDLTNCNTISDASIEGIVSNVPRIRNLILAKCTRLTNESAYSIARLGKNLHYLHLGHVSNLTDRAVCHLARSCTRLRYIDLACCPQLTDLSVLELAANLPKLRRIGLVRVANLTDQAIYGLVERHTSLERIHLSYCENISVPAIFWLLERLPRLTHLSLTGVNAFRNAELQMMCREPPREFNAHQRSAFCVYSGKGVNELRKFLQCVYADPTRAAQFGHLTPEVHNALARLSESRERRAARQQHHQQLQQQEQRSQMPAVMDGIEPAQTQRMPLQFTSRHHGINLDQAMAAQQMPLFNMIGSISEPLTYTSHSLAAVDDADERQLPPFDPFGSSQQGTAAMPNLHPRADFNRSHDDGYERMDEDGKDAITSANPNSGQGSGSVVQPEVGLLSNAHNIADRQVNTNGIYPGQGQTLGSRPASHFGSRFSGTSLPSNMNTQNTPITPGQRTQALAALATPPLPTLQSANLNANIDSSVGSIDHPFAPGRFDPGQMTPIATINPFERYSTSASSQSTLQPSSQSTLRPNPQQQHHSNQEH